MPLFYAASVRPLSDSSPLAWSSYRAHLRLSVFYRHFHTRWTPIVLSVAPLSVFLSGPPTAIISPPPQHLFLPSLCAISTIFYTCNPTYSLPLYLTTLYLYLSIYISIYISPLTHFISPLSLTLTLCLSIFLFNFLVSWTLTHFISLYD